MNLVQRLITQFAPTNYNLSLTLDRPNRQFSGVVTIKGTAYDPKSVIVHSKDLTIDSVLYDGKTSEFQFGPDDQLIIAHPDHQPGDHILTISYHGTITDPMHGLYPCYYTIDGEKKELLATQFESHHAREVFPSIDEPEAKATFDVSLTTETGVTVLGNMPVKLQREEDGQLVTQFETTPIMSSYLLAWVVGDLHSVSTKTKRGVDVSIWSTPVHDRTSLEFALQVARDCIDFYEDYFQTDYPLPKSDHVALPDFSSGAMENWGLVTYREIALLADPKTTSISSKRYVATVIAHELAHQWFGNLVTMKWWNDLWLNESFATMIEYLAVDALFPHWNMWLEFSSNENILALRRDSIDGVQSVQIDVNHPDEISTLFDGAIVYAKGARLLRMLQHYVGDKDFQAGLKEYFKTFAYQNTEASDLWRCIAAASGKDIAEFMNTWLSQPGYPVLHVSYNDEGLRLEQEQFFVGPHEPSSRLWPIVLDSTSNDTPELMSSKSLSVATSDQLIRFNQADSAHYITHYDDRSFQQLLAQAATDQLSPLNRLQLLNETTLLARGGVIPSVQLLPTISAYADETDEAVWGILGLALGELRKFVQDNPAAEQKLRQFSAQTASELYQRLGWTARDGESEDDSKLRATIIGLVLYGQLPDAIKTAQTLYDTTDFSDMDAELRPLILGSVVRNGQPQIVQRLLSEYRATSSVELQQDIALAVTSSRDHDTIVQLLDLIKDSSTVRPQDVGRWFYYLISTREARELAWQWLRDNWQWIETTFEGDKSFASYPRYAAAALATRQELEQYQAFFDAKKDVTALTRAISMGISEIKGRVELIERDGPAVIESLLKG